MTAPPRLVAPRAPVATLVRDFERVRDEFELPDDFPAEVLVEAAEAADRPPRTDGADLREVPFVTIDPPGRRDLDQALWIGRRDGGFRVRYAIADVGAWVVPGGAVEQEAFRRALTFYSPDGRTPLYPPILSEGAASLLEDQDRPAVVFTHDLDGTGERLGLRVERALVRSRRQLSYEQVHDEGFPLLEAVGRRRLALEDARGALHVDAPGQEIVPDGSDGGYRLTLESRLPVEDWNAQLSLLTGIAAADLMLRHRVGLLRTMAPPEAAALDQARRAAAALELEWPEGVGLGAFLRTLDPSRPTHAAMIEAARRAMQRADYTAFAGEVPAEPGHAAIAAPYAHVTAPLRRLADRYVLDLVVALAAGQEPGPDRGAELTRLAETMNRAEDLEGRFERALVDAVEVRLLEGRVGETFDAVVTGVRNGGASIAIPDPPVRASLRADPPPEAGARISVRLTAADPTERALTFTLA